MIPAEWTHQIWAGIEKYLRGEDCYTPAPEVVRLSQLGLKIGYEATCGCDNSGQSRASIDASPDKVWQALLDSNPNLSDRLTEKQSLALSSERIGTYSVSRKGLPGEGKLHIEVDKQIRSSSRIRESGGTEEFTL